MPPLGYDMEVVMSDEKIMKMESKAAEKAAAKDAQEPKVADPIDLDLKALGSDASLLKASNIMVILRIGNEGVRREIPMKHLAREIKARA